METASVMSNVRSSTAVVVEFPSLEEAVMGDPHGKMSDRGWVVDAMVEEEWLMVI